MTIINMVGGGGTSGPQVPLDAISVIAVVGGDTEATITWTDPTDLVVNGVTVTTWTATKLVRKVGSAPTDSTDGTLVVTETVRDTYSVSGYNDTGLTNGTTYYYAAFAVGNNGLETISSTTPSVTPSQGGWQPGANTLAYWTLDNKLTDETGNYDLTLQNGTFTQLASGRYALSLEASGTSSGATYTGGPDLRNTNLTWNLWIKDTASRSGFNDWAYIYLMNGTANILNIAHSGPSQGNRIYGVLGNYNNYNDAPTYDDTIWHNVVFTFNNTTYVLNEYIDDVLKCTTTLSGGVTNTTGITYIGRTGYGNTAHLMVGATIIEDKERTSQEVSDYFNQTKSLYGIS